MSSESKVEEFKTCLEYFGYKDVQFISNFLETYNNYINYICTVDSVHDSSLLHKAVLLKRIEIVQLLVDKGADVNVVDGRGKTPLFYSVSYRNIEISEFLLRKGADINHKDKYGETPLFVCFNHTCFFHRNIGDIDESMYDFLIHYEANINEQNNKGDTMITIAAKRRVYYNTDGYQRGCLSLLKKGADPYITNKKGKNLFNIFKPNNKNWKEIEKWIEENYHCGGVKPAK